MAAGCQSVDRSINQPTQLSYMAPIYRIHTPAVTLGEIRNVIQQNKPHYPWDKEVVCAMEDGMWCVYKAPHNDR